MKITQHDLKKYADEIFAEMSKILSADKIDALKKNFDKNNENIIPDTINYCVEKFVQTELDFITPGDRGIGRLTEALPRLGAYFRNPFSNLEKTELNKLDTLITKPIIKGYLFSAVINGQPKEKALSFTDEELYREWIPKIFTFNLSNISDNAGDLLLAITKNDLDEIKSFFSQHNMRAGGFFSRDKTDGILMSYIIAGVSLYYIEKLKTN